MESISVYRIVLGDFSVPVRFRFPKTKQYFSGFLVPSGEGEASPVYLDDETWNRYRSTIDSTDEIVECYLLVGLVTRYLLPFRRCVFHSAAFRWRGLVWLLCAPSGTGKTTQLRHWINQYGSEIQLISGDKPVLSFSPEDIVTVSASPWNGKECLRGSGSGKLGGIIYLEHADRNELFPADKRKMVAPLFHEFLSFADTRQEILAISELEDTLLRNYPVWILKNAGDEASAALTHDTLSQWLLENRVEPAGDDL